MDMPKSSGFTIIETMLFLAISAGLVIVVMVGASSSINEQRYRDSVTSFKNNLQKQFSEVENVRNEPQSSPLTCGSQTVSRGQNDCVLLGRYVTTVDNTTITSSSVVGSPTARTIVPGNDLDILGQYRLSIVDNTTDSYSVEWGSQLMTPITNQPSAFSILIVRSPQSGVVTTFVNPSQSVSATALDTMVTAASLSQGIKTCIDAGGVLGNRRTAIVVQPAASTAGAVEILGQEAGGC